MFGFGKGKIEIQLENFSYSPGQVIEGTLALTLKKPLHGKELSISFVGRQKTTQGYGSNRTTRTITVFDFKQPLEGEKDYSPGTGPLLYPFKIKIPADAAGQQQAHEGTLGTVMKAAQMFSGTRNMTQWYLIARLDVKGLDITKKVQVNVA